MAANFALISAGLFLLAGMLTGVWKYAHMASRDSATAPVYVDICHRTCLMYAFACLVLQQLALHSRWSAMVNLLAVAIPILFFAAAVSSYALHGFLQDTDNQIRRPHKIGKHLLPRWALPLFMALLIGGEIGGLVVLLAGVI